MQGLGAIEMDLKAQLPCYGLAGVVWGQLRVELAFELYKGIRRPDKGVVGIPNRVKKKKMCKASEVSVSRITFKGTPRSEQQQQGTWGKWWEAELARQAEGRR